MTTSTDKIQLSRDEITRAYELFLGRRPSDIELDRMQQNQQSYESLRKTFLNSQEFLKKQGWTQPPAPGGARTPPEKAQTLIHIHVPKSAGSTLTSVIARHSPRSSHMTVGDNDLERLRLLPPNRRGELRFVFGHLSHGVAGYLPQACAYITVLRDPGTRILSYFRYIQRTADHPLHAPAIGQRMGFGDFLEFSAGTPAARLEIDNGQVRRLAGESFNKSSLGSEAELFRRALHNMFSDDLVYGFTEHFDDFLARLKSRKIIPDYQDTRLNTAPDKTDIAPVLAQLTPAQKKLYDQFTYWDDQFYGICKTAYFAASP